MHVNNKREKSLSNISDKIMICADIWIVYGSGSLPIPPTRAVDMPKQSPGGGDNLQTTKRAIHNKQLVQRNTLNIHSDH